MLIQVVLSTTREDRFSALVGKWVAASLGAYGGLEVEVVDLRDHPLPFFDGAPPAKFPRQYPTLEVARLGERLDRADGYVMLVAEYNHGYPAVLKNAIDWTFVEWRHKPVSFVGWGNVGGARAIEQLRLVTVELEMAPLRHAVSILPDVLVRSRTAADPATVLAELGPKLDLLAADLAWWTAALATARERDGDRW